MKFSTLATAALAAATAQANVIPRDASTISDLLESVFQSMTNADNHVLDFQSNPAGLHEAGYALLDTLACGTKVAKAMEYLSLHDIACIADVSGRLSNIGTKFLADLEAAAPLFAAYGVCEYAYDFSLSFSDLSNQFFEANKEKFPYESQAMADQEITAKNAEFARAQAALAPGVASTRLSPPRSPACPILSPRLPLHTTPALSWPPTQPRLVHPMHPAHQLPPSAPIGAPVGGPVGGQPEGHNGTHSGQPPKPIIGSANFLGSSWSLSLLPVVVAAFLA
ncbi:hypothetical protein CIB48_g12025 [Xylaria polymorpha]|nr:hypothetical protein CIB48_g12025 [Xylaria polymorpha]